MFGKQLFKQRRGQGLVSAIVGLLVALIILVAVVIPVVNDVISNSGLSGIALTIANLFLPMLLLGGFMLIVMTFFVGRR